MSDDDGRPAFQQSIESVLDTGFGLEVEDWRKRTDDHLVTQLQFLAHMLDAEAGNGDLSMVARFMDEHPLR